MSALVTVSYVLVDIGRGLREGLFMFWESLWALVLGFSLSGVVQAFISKDQMRAKMGSHRPAVVARASGYGMVSSSCSYAASAMAKSLFAKGADFTSAMIFMFASTNLVVELGVVLLVLLGWQFAVAEFVGGPIMIVMLALAGGVFLSGPVIERARRRVRGENEDGPSEPLFPGDGPASGSLKEKIHSPAAWADASAYAVADATMLRRELAIGYVVAGLLAALVPSHTWNILFLHGHGFWTSAENALVGPLIAVISWVCSIGNVPLAAALWSGGIAFGGVVAFLFADLISMPLILIYRKLYGGALTLRMVALFYAVMTVAGLVTEGIFSALGIVPSRRTVTITTAHFQWNYTTYLNILFIIVAGGVWWLARNRRRFGGGEGYAIDPVCGMQVRVADAPARTVVQGRTYYFCANRCRERFDESPDRFTNRARNGEPSNGTGDDSPAIDPVCGMTVDPVTAAAHRVHRGGDIWFCNVGCAERFDQDPERFTTPGAVPEGMPARPVGITLRERPRPAATTIDPVCGMAVDPATAAAHRVHRGGDVWFCSVGCAERFDLDPERFTTPS